MARAAKRYRAEPVSSLLGSTDSLAGADDAERLAAELGISDPAARQRLSDRLGASFRKAGTAAAIAPRPGFCSFPATGLAAAAQPCLKCLTCVMDRVCEGCARSCHAGHALVRPTPDGGVRAFCQCGAGGRCAAGNAASLCVDTGDDDAGAVAAVCEAILCWGLALPEHQAALAASADELGFIPLAALHQAARAASRAVDTVSETSLASALQRHGLCRFAKFGSAGVKVAPRHPHGHVVIHLAARALREAARGRGAAGWPRSVRIRRAATLPRRVPDAVLCLAASVSAEVSVSGGAGPSAAGVAGPSLRRPAPPPDECASLLAAASGGGLSSSGGRVAAFRRSFLAARATTGGGPPADGHHPPERPPGAGADPLELSVPGPDFAPGDRRAAQARVERLQAQRDAAARAAARLRGEEPAWEEEPAWGQQSGGPLTAGTAAPPPAAPPAAAAASSGSVAAELVIAGSEADVAGPCGRAHSEAGLQGGRLGLAVVREGRSTRARGVALAFRSRAAGGAEGSFAAAVEGGGAGPPAGALSVVVAVLPPGAAAPDASRRGADPTGDRTALQPLLPLLFDASVVKACFGLGDACADLSADVGLFIVNGRECGGLRGGGADASAPRAEDATGGGAAAEASAAVAALASRSLAAMPLLGDAAASAARSAVLALLAAETLPPPGPLDDVASHLLCLSAPDVDWGKAGSEVPPLTAAPWYLRCNRCGGGGHFALACPVRG